MASNDKRALLAWTLAATILSGAAWWLGTGLAPQAWLTWLAPLPLLLIAPRLRWQYAGLAALCAGACAGLNLWHYLCGVIGLPVTIGVLVAVGAALKFALSLLLHRYFLLSGRPGRALLAFPALWVALDYLGSLGSPHGVFGTLAHSQVDALHVLQLASLTGLWGVSFIVLLAPSALAVVLLPDVPPRQRALAGGVAALLVVATFGFGAVRLQQPASGSIRIGLASLDGPFRASLATAEGKAQLQRYLAVIDKLAAQGAQAVVLPETAFSTDQPAIPELAASAARHRIWIDAGVALKGRNQALAYGPSPAVAAGYAKHHLIPGLEGQYQPGTDYAMLAGTRTGLAICKDMDFHDTGRAYAARGANLLLVPAWDFDVDGTMHSRMAVLRGVENGLAIARAAKRGNLTLSDDRGRIVAETSDAQGSAQLVSDLPLHQSRTLYARWGDWFAWLDLFLLAMILPPRRRKRENT
ncbi:nitrilase-related carbon-nitrogen hydrolase [Duganella sp. Dugasp56]|uniref:nitrilase-related carbon-nitrogen hydrolase n=1 Tax=Duganella sp. Dugasp56 TaxID=3243046 RepID=UPI0039B00352